MMRAAVARPQLWGRHAVLVTARRSMASGATEMHNFINGEFVKSAATTWIDVHNPATQEVVARVPQSTPQELDAATAAAAAAFKSWSSVPVQQRQRVMFKLQQLVVANTDELAANITLENGKTLADARGDVFRGQEVVESACNIAALTMGETQNNVASGMDCYSYRQPLGVCAGICPFNFPAMIPMWMFPMACTTGNTFVLKPSERTPGAAMILAQMAKDAGLPDGVLNIVHGAHDTVNFLCTDPRIRAVSFVGGDVAGRHIFDVGTKHNKKVQANLGAKNHVTIMPDADKNATLNALASSCFGAAGQRCMALSHAIFVGETKNWIPELAERGKKMKISAGHVEGTDLGPMISPRALERAHGLIAAGVENGGTLVLDGRSIQVSDFPKGNFLGPTILADLDAKNPAYTNEIFGPVLGCTAVDTLDEAIAFTNANPYGNGCAIFTGSGAAARKYQHEIDAGQVGVNVPIPVPLPTFSFSGSRSSVIGGHYFYGRKGAEFFTQVKTITSNWKYTDTHANVSASMPVMK